MLGKDGHKDLNGHEPRGIETTGGMDGDGKFARK